MKKGENITLIIGIACVLTVVVWQVIEFSFHYYPVINEVGFKYFIVFYISPIVIFLFPIIPIILLVRNLKNKTGKLIPIISIIINSAVLLWVLFLSFTPTILQYIIYSKLGLIDSYFTVILLLLENGGLLSVVGYSALIVGSLLSFIKNKKQNIIGDENTNLTDN